MNALRSSPFLSPACLLHIVIFSCCVIGFAPAVEFFDRQSFMNALRSSPFLSPACWLHIVIFDCWLFCAKAGGANVTPERTAANADRAIADRIFIGHSKRVISVIGDAIARRLALEPQTTRAGWAPSHYGKAIPIKARNANSKRPWVISSNLPVIRVLKDARIEMRPACRLRERDRCRDQAA